MSWQSIMLVAAGGALGATLRFVTTSLVGSAYLFPWATFGINIAGALLIGIVWGIGQEAAWFHNWGRLFLVVGVLGGFTTFSAFSFETLELLKAQRVFVALAYICVSVSVCVLLAWVGLKIGQQVSS